MRSVSATEAKQRLAALLDAAQREPVLIRRQNRDVAVIMSAQEYERIRRINIDELERTNKSTALVTLCIGGGMGTATIIERV